MKYLHVSRHQSPREHTFFLAHLVACWHKFMRPLVVYSPTFTTRVRWSKEREEVDVDVGDDVDVEARCRCTGRGRVRVCGRDRGNGCGICRYRFRFKCGYISTRTCTCISDERATERVLARAHTVSMLMRVWMRTRMLM